MTVNWVQLHFNAVVCEVFVEYTEGLATSEQASEALVELIRTLFIRVIPKRASGCPIAAPVALTAIDRRRLQNEAVSFAQHASHSHHNFGNVVEI